MCTRSELPELSHLVPGFSGPPVLPRLAVGLQSLQEFEQSLLRDFTASSLHVGEGREAKGALQAVLLRVESLVTGRVKGEVGARSARLSRRGRRD